MDSTNNTLITYEQARQDANTLKECSTKMRNIFEEFEKIMNETSNEDVFAGNASQSLSSRFNALKGRFDSFTRTVETFSNMVSSATASAEQTERSIAEDADSLAG